MAPNDIQAVTGNQSLASIDHYSRVMDKTRSAMSAQLATACIPNKTLPKRPLYSGEFSRSNTIICTPAKGKKKNANCPDIVKTVTVETEKNICKICHRDGKKYSLRGCV